MVIPTKWIVKRKVVSFLLVILMTVVPWALPFKVETDSMPEGVIITVYSFHIAVDETELAERFKTGRWNGEKKNSFGHSAEVIDGELWIDGKNIGPISDFYKPA